MSRSPRRCPAVVLAIAASLFLAPGAFAEETFADLYAQGDEAYDAEDWPACAELYVQASDASRWGPNMTALYNAACCHALGGDVDGAFTVLERAREAGFRNAELVERDADLSALHEDTRWPEFTAAVNAAEATYLASINAELKEMHDADQADRRPPIDWDAVSDRDLARRERAREILDAGGATVADDWFHAALIFQHGWEEADYEVAVSCAKRAVEMDPTNATARWLKAAAEDRLLMKQGKPQKYGTQSRKVDERWELWEVDPSVTDEDRAEWNVPPLATALRRIEERNAEAAEAEAAP